MAVLLAGEGHNAKAYSEVGRTDTVANSLSEPDVWPCRQNLQQWVTNEQVHRGRTLLFHSTLPAIARTQTPSSTVRCRPPTTSRSCSPCAWWCTMWMCRRRTTAS